MKKNLIYFLVLFCVYPAFSFSQTISNVEIVPTLDVSYFSSYKIKANITGSPSSVEVQLSGLNSDNVSYWNYFVDGTPLSEMVTKIMSFDSGENKYISENIYPDSIYPEIFFASSSVTWNNTPLNLDIRRSNYHLLHFDNPFTMVASSSFFIEINSLPKSIVNSTDLSVYLVKNNKDISFFNSDWRTSSDVELVGVFDKNATYHHTHVINKAAHHLVSLMVNPDGTVGLKNLDISNDFWIILYSDSPNTNRAWNLKYHPTSLCTNSNSWYIGNQSGWSTTLQNGCPDSHIHIARRTSPYIDAVIATTTAYYSDNSTVVSNNTFVFNPLPNLAPNGTSFTSPSVGGIYDGGLDNKISISWDPASDSNNDILNYTLYLINDVSTTTILSASTTVSMLLDISLIDDGEYTLNGEVCDNGSPVLCTDFNLGGYFTIDKIEPIYSLTNINILSNNSSTTQAKPVDTITLSFDSTGDISAGLNVLFYSGGYSINGSVSSSSISNSWEVFYTVDSDDVSGTIDFVINSNNLDLVYSEVSDNSYVFVDTTIPESVIANPSEGTYDQSQIVSLTSSGSSYIKYTIDNSTPTCNLGTLYQEEIAVSSPINIKAIGCDYSGSSSIVNTFEYNFMYSLVYIADLGGIISGSSTQFINYNNNSLSVTATPDSRYRFLQWSDDLTSAIRQENNLIANATYTATFRRKSGNNYVTCTEYDYTDWSICNNGTQTKEIINAYPSGCIQDDSVVKRSCNVEDNKEKTKEAQSTSTILINIDTGEIKNNKIIIFTKDLRFNDTDEEVKLLQKFLNSQGFKLAQNGVGSLGKETNYFGSLTKSALIKYQEANAKDILIPIYLTKGTGYFGFMTRNYTNSLFNK